MGYGNYSHRAHVDFTAQRAKLPREQVFIQTGCHPLMNPHGVRARECRDSPEHPNSLGIAFALDVTGSMGQIPELIARTELPNFMKALGQLSVADPQILFLAVGDAYSDKAALQVGQFETTAELMDQWLTSTFIEGGGGGQNKESYELALYFLAQHTYLDSWHKRKKRGYLFMTGDELAYPAVSRRQVESLLGDQLDEDIPTEAVVAAISETYHPFFLIPDPSRRARCERPWRDLLGDNVICMERPEDTCQVAAGVVALTEGGAPDVDAVAQLFRTAGVGNAQVATVINALTPYAASLGKDRSPLPPLSSSLPRVAEGISGWVRNLLK